MSDNKISSINRTTNGLHRGEKSHKKINVIHRLNKFQPSLAFQAMADPQSAQALLRLIKNLIKHFSNTSKQNSHNRNKLENNAVTNNATSQLNSQKNTEKKEFNVKDNIADYKLATTRSSHRKSNEKLAEKTKKSFLFSNKNTLQTIVTNNSNSVKFSDTTLSTRKLNSSVSTQVEKQTKLSTEQYRYTSDQFELAADTSSSPTEKHLSSFNATASTVTQEAFNKNKTLWLNSKVENYSYTLQRSCQCISYHTLAVFMTVKGGEIINACFENSDKKLLEKHSENKLSIKDLFSLIQHEIDENHQLEVVYSKENGMPVTISLFHDKLSRDGKSTITSSNLQKN